MSITLEFRLIAKFGICSFWKQLYYMNAYSIMWYCSTFCYIFVVVMVSGFNQGNIAFSQV